ncbi:hypothetical protein KOI40_13775 [Aestuariicella sp. G3-2]|uniref:3-deoxy-D-manno-octulosonic acid transferase n=1 Tax=Pseudomaricurvus albidus TaxID=2842452 RepID=UPI001C0BDA43|nr:glycosyltransferase N-terminal domain-containing protein [Aestuariicella albida]MBU3070891.1 hypothetical protein [Aestuariicella albida]
MTLPNLTDLKVVVFEWTERLIERLRSQDIKPAHILHDGSPSKNPDKKNGNLWVYVSTIGELNATSNLIDELLNVYSGSQLVLLTDHPHYLDAYLKKYPDATVINHGESGRLIHEQIQKYPPFLFLIAEIPLALFDAPCRLSFKTLYYVKQTGSKIIAVNGWLYGEKPACTMDTLESALFAKPYTEIIDQFLIQQSSDIQKLVDLGVSKNKIHTTGNLKFDNLVSGSPAPLKKSEIIEFERMVMVSGCVTNISEQELILETFKLLKREIPDLLLIMAPRHPENKDRMKILGSMLKNSGWKYLVRTEQIKPVEPQIDILVLNTIGELHDFYSIGDFCYVGLNHNLLEPLSFAKPTFLTPGWEPQYPSFPVYSILKEKGVIQECSESSPKELSNIIIDNLHKKNAAREAQIATAINTLSGSVEQSKYLISKVM